MGAYDPAGRETILALVKVLRYLDITFGVLRKEKCNGDPARRLGNDLLFTTLAEENSRTSHASKANKILSICPHCVRTMSTDWQEAGRTVEIEHHSELLARHKHAAARDADEPNGKGRLSRSLLSGPLSRRLR